MTLGERCKAEVIKKMEKRVEAYREMYDIFIKTGNCTSINCCDCPFDKDGIGHQYTDLRCSTPARSITNEFCRELNP